MAGFLHPYVGVCSWSLRAHNPVDLVNWAQDTGADSIQLALDPIRTHDWRLADVVSNLERSRLLVRSGMFAPEGEDYSTLESIRRTGGVVPDHTWERNLEAARGCAQVAAALGIPLVTLHAGFIPDSGPGRSKIVDRIGTLMAAFRVKHIRLALETGQESPAVMSEVMQELNGPTHVHIGVNFDPANIILYGEGDPISAIRTLAPWIIQCHVKDALPPARRGEWGTETVVGHGAVDWPAFFALRSELEIGGDLIVEREAGDNRIADAAAAVRLVKSFLNPERAR